MSELSPQTQRLVQRARKPEPLDADRKAKLKAALITNIAAAALTTSTTTAAASAGFAKLLAWFGVGAALSLGVVAASHLVTAKHHSAPLVAQPSSVPTPSAVHADPSPVSSTILASELPSSTQLPVASVASRLPTSSDVAEERPSLPVASVEAPLPSAAPPAASVRPEQLALQEEVRLIRQADLSIQSGDGAGAMRLLGEHAQRFPSGALAPERSVLRVLALCAMGNVAAAKAEAAPVLRAGGPLQARLQTSCVTR